MIIDDVYRTTGIPATCGIGTNLYLAKVALDITAKHVKSHMAYLDEQIYQKIWGNYVQDIENNTIGSHVCKLREKLYKACPDRKFEIRCVRETGYCFEAKQDEKQSDLDGWAVFCCHYLYVAIKTMYSV